MRMCCGVSLVLRLYVDRLECPQGADGPICLAAFNKLKMRDMLWLR